MDGSSEHFQFFWQILEMVIQIDGFFIVFQIQYDHNNICIWFVFNHSLVHKQLFIDDAQFQSSVFHRWISTQSCHFTEHFQVAALLFALQCNITFGIIQSQWQPSLVGCTETSIFAVIPLEWCALDKEKFAIRKLIFRFLISVILRTSGSRVKERYRSGSVRQACGSTVSSQVMNTFVIPISSP